MAQRVEVDCITKRDRYNPHERIEGIGGRNADGSRWYLQEDRAIADVEAGKWSFYVNRGRIVDVIVAVHNGRKYLKTVADGYAPDNLLSLNSCSVR